LEAPFRPGDESLKIKWFSLRPLFDLSLQRRDGGLFLCLLLKLSLEMKRSGCPYLLRGVPERKTLLSCPLLNFSLKGRELETQTRSEMRP
jgi:hypothetical protein